MSNVTYAELKAQQDRIEEMLAANAGLHAEARDARAPIHDAGRLVKSYVAPTRGMTGGFRSVGHFLKAFHEGHAKPREHPALKRYIDTMEKAQPPGYNETVLADGGVFVPPQFATELLRHVYQNDLLSRTRLFPLTSSPFLKIPMVSESSRANGSRFGGVQGYWRNEGGLMTESKGQFDELALNCESLYVLARCTNELLEDAGAMDTWISTVANEELQFKIGEAIVRGDGVGKPMGILNAPCKIVQAAEPGQGATIVTENISKMWGRLHVSCRPNAVWLVNQEVEPMFDQLTVGTAGAQMAAYLPPGGLSAAPYATMKGRPVLASEFCSAVGTEGDIILTDLSQYITATRGGMDTGVSIHIYWLTAETSFRFMIRLDGKPWWKTAITPYLGTNTLSCTVTLATR